MATFDAFSKRLKTQKRAGQPDVFQYDHLPPQFRNQVIHIWNDAIGQPQQGNPFDPESWSPSNGWWDTIHSQMARELGMLSLSKQGEDSYDKCVSFLQKAEVLGTLDLIELTFRFIDTDVRRDPEIYYVAQGGFLKMSPDQAIDELNQRFREHAIGYEFIGGQLIRKDSQFVHAEAVRPALQLLADAQFHGANQEFLRAHEHYRHGRHEEAMQDALKAFESTLKTICDLHQWSYKPTDTAKALIDVVFAKGLIRGFLSSQFSALRTVIESGLPTVRNKMAGHGAGSQPRNVPAYLTAFALHVAASNIVMLIEAHRAMK